MKRTYQLCTAMAAALWATSAAAGSIDFNSLVNGQIVDNEFAGVTISAHNIGGGPDLAVIFDSNLSDTEDPDLEFGAGGIGGAGWENGNLNEDLGNLLIIEENALDGDGNGIIDGDPDDEGSRPAGSIFFDFAFAIDSFGFDLIDVEGPAEFNQNAGYFATFFINDTVLRRVGFGALVDPGSSFYDSSILFGDNSANRVSPITAADLDIAQFDGVEINFGGSAAIDNINWTQPSQAGLQVPEPSSLILLAVALIGMGFACRQRLVPHSFLQPCSTLLFDG